MLAALPKSAQPSAKAALAEIWGAEDKTHALKAVAAFEADFGAKFPKAVAKITDDVDTLLAFYDYPAEHWIHLRTTDENVNAGPVISLFSRAPTQLLLPCGPQPRSRWSARSEARTYDLDHGEDRDSVRLWWARVTAERRAACWD